ncbi:MAG: hypothetical protein JNN01_13955 [Opitutaceae bacterium]|nr:hypothetical protein [Opitutaceae bacterium]
MKAAPDVTWDSLDWRALDRLRAGFLDGQAAQGPYWKSPHDLAAYDLTYGERIGWKWDAVLRELRLRSWAPAPASAGLVVLDWGCGSGIAGRRVIAAIGPEKVSRLLLWDHSPLAVAYAVERARSAFPGLTVDAASGPSTASDVLVVSHVLNEIPPAQLSDFRSLLTATRSLLWVEPGTHEVSRSLQQWREHLLADGAHLVAPCTHQGSCGLLRAGEERHWCHHFAPPPVGVHADRHWVRFAQRAGIDLRSLPYAFVIAERTASSAPFPAGAARLIGRPEHFKPYARTLSCDAAGVTEVTLPRRTLPDLYKHLERNRGPLLYRWERQDNTVTAGESLIPLGSS